MAFSVQLLPIAAGQTINVTGHSIDTFSATAAGVLTVTGPDAVVRGIPVVIGPNSISAPISADSVDEGTATIVSSAGAAGVVGVAGAPGPAISHSPTTLTVAQLPAAATTPKGTRATVSDSTLAYTTANVGTTVVGGNTNTAPVFNNGTNWIIG